MSWCLAERGGRAEGSQGGRTQESGEGDAENSGGAGEAAEEEG